MLGKRFTCSLPACQRGFYNKTQLNRHIKSKHGPTNQYKCTYASCSHRKGFTLEDSLKTHYREQHGGISNPESTSSTQKNGVVGSIAQPMTLQTTKTRWRQGNINSEIEKESAESQEVSRNRDLETWYIIVHV